MLLHLLPGDPVEVMLHGTNATQEQRDSMRHELGLDRPMIQQYVSFVSRAVQGDFGRSIRTQSVVMREIRGAFPDTLKLTLAGMAVAIVIGFGLGNSGRAETAKLDRQRGHGLCALRSCDAELRDRHPAHIPLFNRVALASRHGQGVLTV